MTDAPIEAYRQRAGNGGPTDPSLRALLTVGDAPTFGAVSNSSRTVWADISKYQRVVTDAYPEPMLSFRADSGGAVDVNAAANWAWCEKTDRLKVALAYIVLIPGNEAAILARLKNLFGAAAPPKLAVMIDMESGSGFAGGGNHSSSANKMDALISGWLGSRDRVVGYANSPDWSGCWPTRRADLKRVTAAYSSAWPGTWAQQYYGGMSYPVPAGLPRTMAPFGSNVDLNVAHRSIDQIVTDLGLGEDDMPTAAEIAAAVAATKTIQDIHGYAHSADNRAALYGPHSVSADNRAGALRTQVAALQACVDALPKAVWNADILPNPSGEHLKENPTWAPASVLAYMYKNAKSAADGSAANAKAIAAIGTAVAKVLAQIVKGS